MADVSSTLRLWSKTAGSNSPIGGGTVGTGLAPNLQQIQATVRQYMASPATAMASATTVDLSTADGKYISITGTVTITGFGTESAGIEYILVFTGALTLTYNATSLIIPGGVSKTTVAGDIAWVESLGGGNWKVIAYEPFGVTGTGSTVLSASPTFTGTVTAPTFSGALTGNATTATSATTATTATNQSGGTVNATTGSFSGQVTSTIATGTPPLAVTSTTAVTNLSIGGTAATVGLTQFASSLASNGYQKLPSGLIIQWGLVNKPSAGDLVITLPIAMPVTIRSVTVTPQYTAGISQNLAVTATTTTNFTVNDSNGAANYNLYWMAIGH